MNRMLLAALLCMTVFSSHSQLKVSDDSTHLVTNAGKPFFWLGDTAWELFHRLSRQEAKTYLKNRADKGFTVIQAVVLAELDGLNTPNAAGHKPLLGNDPAKPNEAYFREVDYVVDEAEKLGLYIGMLPSWGDKWNKAWGQGPVVFNAQNAEVFGEYLGKRYRNKPVIWIMGGDRNCEKPEHFAIIEAMVRGLKKTDGGKHLFTFHPQGGKSSSDFFKNASWINFHMSQTGHSVNSPNYTFNRKHLSFRPLKPHLDGEPRYEDHPNAFNAAEKGWMDDFDTRQAAYWSMLSGAFGHTYGNHNIWQMYTEERQPVSMARTHWKVALDHPGSFQMGYMRKLFESRPWQRLVADQSVILSDNPEGAAYAVASVSKDGDFLMAYLPYGKKIEIKLDVIHADSIRTWWFNPRDGRSMAAGVFSSNLNVSFTPPSVGRGSDWILIADDASKAYTKPAASLTGTR